jgi:hypothetical protein
MNLDSKMMFESFISSLHPKADVLEEKKKSKSTNAKADVDGDGKKGTKSDKYLADLHARVAKFTQVKKHAEEAAEKARGDKITVASHMLLKKLHDDGYSTQECEHILRQSLDTHVAAKTPVEAELTPVVSSTPTV